MIGTQTKGRMATDAEIINDVYDIVNNLPDMTKEISGQLCYYKEDIDMARLRSLHPHFNEALAVLCGIVEACRKTEPGEKIFTRKVFYDNKELI